MTGVPPDPSSPGPGQPEGPPQYVGYTRSNSSILQPEQIRALADAYRGFSWVFLIDFLTLLITGFIAGVVSVVLKGDFVSPIILFSPYVLTGIVVFFVSQGPSRQYAIGMGRNPSGAVVTSIVLGLQGWLCCGAFGYAILQGRLSKELKKCGLKAGFLGIPKADVEEVIAQMQAGIPAPPPPGIPPPPMPS
jgi:hypothetical protein